MACKVVPGTDSEFIVSISVLKMESVFHLPDLYGAFFFSPSFLEEQEAKPLPEQSPTDHKLWLSQRCIFPLTINSNEQNTFCFFLLFHSFCGVSQHVTLKPKVGNKKKKRICSVNLYFCLESFSGCLWHPIKSLKHACCIFNCHFKCQNPEVLLILYVNSVCLCSNPQAL